MNFCPSCGSAVDHIETVSDIATNHAYYRCRSRGCGMKWEETYSNSDETILSISPCEEDEGGT